MSDKRPPADQGWNAPGTCGGGYWRVVNGIYESWPPNPRNTVTLGAGLNMTSPTSMNEDTTPRVDVEAWWAATAKVTQERDQAREDCGFQKGLKDSIKDELRTFIRLRTEALAERDEALATLERVKAVLIHSHADTCATELSPNAGYECSCWRGSLEAALVPHAD